MASQTAFHFSLAPKLNLSLFQVEAIHSYNNMKQNLMDYLSKFADNKKVVREEDIKEFFENMKNKKPRISGPPPSNCKW